MARITVHSEDAAPRVIFDERADPMVLASEESAVDMLDRLELALKEAWKRERRSRGLRLIG